MKQAEKPDYAAFMANIPEGKENAILAADLMQKTGYKSKRGMQEAIQKARAAGCLISSRMTNGGGYFQPATREEKREYAERTTNRGKATIYAAHYTRKALETVPGQLRHDFTDPAPDPAPEGPESAGNEELQKRDI